MNKLLLILSLSLGLTTAAQAGFINNKTSWDDLPMQMKLGYAMGRFDDLVMGQYNDTSVEQNRRIQLGECASRLNLTSSDMVAIIDKEYEDLSSWQWPPLLQKGLCTVCYPACK